jgi:dihydroorotate dehydrogenase electron transfer subunit
MPGGCQSFSCHRRKILIVWERYSRLLMQKDPLARIVNKQNWGSYFLLSLETRAIASGACPGQFVMVRASSGNHPLLRRPFSIFDRGADTVDIFFQKTGLGTDLLSRKTRGDTLDILGPLGRGFSLEGQWPGGTALLVGGGRGIAPLFFLAGELDRKGASVIVLYGAKTESDLPLIGKLRDSGFSFLCSTENGSLGHHGQITELLEMVIEKEKPNRIYACGPEAMLEKTTQLAKNKNVAAELSLESIMGCGFGACWGCVKRIREGRDITWVKICEKGPVFPSQDVVWEGEEL